MESHPCLVEFTKTVNHRIADDPATGFFSLADDLRALVFDTDVLTHVATNHLRAISANPAHESVMWEPHYLVLAYGPGWQLRVGLYQHSSEFIYSMPQHMIVAIVGNETLVADHYALPSSIDNEVFDPKLKLGEPVRKRHMHGDVVMIDGRHDVFDVVIEKPVLVVKLSTTVHQALQWAFDRMSRRAIQAIAADPVDSELVSMARALGAMARPTGTPALVDLTHHPRHFVRWAALQALGRTSPELLIPRLESALQDTHVHVRQAAQSALKRLLAAQE